MFPTYVHSAFSSQASSLQIPDTGTYSTYTAAGFLVTYPLSTADSQELNPSDDPLQERLHSPLA